MISLLLKVYIQHVNDMVYLLNFLFFYLFLMHTSVSSTLAPGIVLINVFGYLAQ